MGALHTKPCDHSVRHVVSNTSSLQRRYQHSMPPSPYRHQPIPALGRPTPPIQGSAEYVIMSPYCPLTVILQHNPQLDSNGQGPLKEPFKGTLKGALKTNFQVPVVGFTVRVQMYKKDFHHVGKAEWYYRGLNDYQYYCGGSLL